MNKEHKMKCIVTGGCGFIGSHIVDQLLNEGHSVFVVDDLSNGKIENIEQHLSNPNLRGLQMDINHLNEFENKTKLFNGADWVFHLAGKGDIVPSIRNPEGYFRTNVNGTFNIVQLCKKYNVKKLIYAASSSCYGIPDVYPTPETTEIRCEHPYALTKYLGEQMVLHWGKVYKLPVVSLRIGNAYGLRQRTSGTYGSVMGVFLKQKLEGKPFTRVGDGEQKRDYVYVTDVANAFVMAAKSDVKNEIMNIGSDNPQSINRLIELLGGGEIVQLPDRPAEPKVIHLDTTKIREIGWRPTITFEEGIKEMVDNIHLWKDAPLWDKKSIMETTKDWFKYLG